MLNILSGFKKDKNSSVTAHKPAVTQPDIEKKASEAGNRKTVYSAVLKRPYLTEKSKLAGSQSKYAFVVEPSATKKEVKEAAEKRFGVNVQKVNILRTKGKMKRFGNKRNMTAGLKKAVVTLIRGQKIEEIS